MKFHRVITAETSYVDFKDPQEKLPQRLLYVSSVLKSVWSIFIFTERLQRRQWVSANSLLWQNGSHLDFKRAFVAVSRAHTSTDSPVQLWEISKNVDLSHNVQDICPLYLDLHQKLAGSILDHDPSCVQVWWKSVQQFSCHLDNKPTKTTENFDVLVKVGLKPSTLLYVSHSCN